MYNTGSGCLVEFWESHVRRQPGLEPCINRVKYLFPSLITFYFCSHSDIRLISVMSLLSIENLFKRPSWDINYLNIIFLQATSSSQVVTTAVLYQYSPDSVYIRRKLKSTFCNIPCRYVLFVIG